MGSRIIYVILAEKTPWYIRPGGDGRRGGVAVAVDVDHALLLADAHAARRGVDDAQVGLVRHEEAHVLARRSEETRLNSSHWS